MSTEEVHQEKYENLNATDLSTANPSIEIKEIEFEGLERTNEVFFKKALGSFDSIRSLNELSAALNKTFSNLERLNMFKDVSVVIDHIDEVDEVSKDKSADGSTAPDHQVKLIFKCKEKRFNVRTGTELQRKDIAWNFGGNFFNIFGRAESLEINSSIGANSSMPFSLNFTKPIDGNPDKLFIFSSSRFKENFQNHCKWRNDTQTLSSALQLNTPTGRHEFKYLAEWRHLFDVQSEASHVIRDQAGHSFKSSIIHSWSLSTRDDAVLPTKGQMARLTNEIAGLGGDSKFIKSEITLQNVWTPSLTKIFSLSNTLKFGYIFPLTSTSATNPVSNPVPIQDRFQMGGPTSIRGFSVNSLGPRHFSDSIGGTGLMELGAQISFPFIQSVKHFARGHLFVNVGFLSENAGKICYNAIKERSFKSLAHKQMYPNVSVGAGFMFKMAETARLELNFAVPIVSQEGIESNRGIQVGIGMEFL